MVRGTYYLLGSDAAAFRGIERALRSTCLQAGYQEFIPSALSTKAALKEQGGVSLEDKLWSFRDRGGRDVCLIPEATFLARKLYKDTWERTLPKPVRLFYMTRCYRYDRPQHGRYREFWQFGVEHLGGDGYAEVCDLLQACLKAVNLTGYVWQPVVERGLDYYTEHGFEVECERLGAQKQLAGGGRYDCGVGWALGMERLLLALREAR